MKLFEGPISPARARRRNLLLALMIVALAAIGVCAPGLASAAVFKSGQQEAWSEATGAGEEEFFDPRMLAVDPENGNVFISNLLSGFLGTRIQEFTESGELIGETASIPTDGIGQSSGLAMDPKTGTIYLLEGESGEEPEESTENDVIATRIRAFDATPTLGTKDLPAAANPELEVPAVGRADTLFNPRELTLDPKTGDLIILAENRLHQIVLQRIGTAGSGSVGEAYVDTTETLAPQGINTPEFNLNNSTAQIGIAVAKSGTAYLISSFLGNQTEIHLHMLPPEFTSASTLTSVPGIEAAATTESWISHRVALEPPFKLEFPGAGTQVAVSSSPVDGSGETLYFKVELTPGGATGPGSYYVRGYSLTEESTSVAFGGGPAGGQCKIQSNRAPLAIGRGGSLEVLDPGAEIFELGEELFEPGYAPWVLRFGPEAGSDSSTSAVACPVPGAAFGIEAEGGPVTSVPVGTTVTLKDESELGGQSLSGTNWKVEGPEDATGSEATLEHKFEKEGTYTLRMQIKTSPVEPIGTTFTARPRTLVVTAGGGVTEFPLTLTTAGTGSGAFKCKVEGGAEEPCAAEYPQGKQVEVIPHAAVGSEFAGWSGDCSGSTACTVAMTAARNVGATFNLESGTPGQKFMLTVTKSGTGTGTVTSTPAGIDCGTTCSAEIAEGEVTLTEAPGSGFEFAGWSGACSGTGTCKVDLTAAATVNAEFKKAATPEFTFGVSKTGTGTGTVKCNGGECAAKYLAGTRITLTAAADSGSTFGGWSGGGCNGTGICVVTIESASTVAAAFTGNPPANEVKPPAEVKPSPPAEVKPSPPVETHPGPKQKTKVEILGAQRKAALKKCQKLKGKPKVACMKKAHQIGKPKKKAKKGKGATRELVLSARWDSL